MMQVNYQLGVVIAALEIVLAGVAWGADRADWAAEAVKCRPHPRQLAWQRGEFTCFIHFGPNTFTNLGWGTGKEDPNIFSPARLVCEQWVRAA